MSIKYHIETKRKERHAFNFSTSLIQQIVFSLRSQSDWSFVQPSVLLQSTFCCHTTPTGEIMSMFHPCLLREWRFIAVEALKEKCNPQNNNDAFLRSWATKLVTQVHFSPLKVLIYIRYYVIVLPSNNLAMD